MISYREVSSSNSVQASTKAKQLRENQSIESESEQDDEDDRIALRDDDYDIDD